MYGRSYGIWLAIWLCCVLAAAGLAWGAGFEGGIGAIGDRLTDEYQFADGGNHSAGRNWLELLAVNRGLNFGGFTSVSRGVPRYQGYEYNWSRAGATTVTMLSEGQPAGVVGQILGGQVQLVCVMIGNNDFGHNYAYIYNGGYFPVSPIVDNTKLAVDTVLSADPTVKIVLATVPDWELDPWFRENYPDAAKRQRVRDAMADYNQQITAYAQGNLRIALADVYQMSLDIIDRGSLSVGGLVMDLAHWGDTPDKLILNDTIHPGTIAQGLIANEFIKAMNVHGAQIDPLTDGQILSSAGVYRLTASVEGEHGTVSPTTGLYIKGVKVSLMAVPDHNYVVAKWTGTDSDGIVSQANQVTMDSDKTVTVKFGLSPYVRYRLTTSVSPAGSGVVEPMGGTYASGVTVPVTALSNAGYKFKKWTGTDNDTSAEAANKVTMSSDRTVTAEFEFSVVRTYFLTTTVISGNGKVLPGTGNHEAGEVVTLTAEPNTGYRVKKWTDTDNDTCVECVNKVTMNGNHTVSVEFEAIPLPQFKLTATVVGGGGTVNPELGTYTSGRVVEVKAVPAAGYRVRQWSGTDDDSITGNTARVTLNADRTVGVVFEPIPITPMPTPTETPMNIPDPEEPNTSATAAGACGTSGMMFLIALVLAGWMLKETDDS